MEGLQTHKSYKQSVQRMSSIMDISNIDYRTRSRSNHPPFVWMRGVLHDQLRQAASLEVTDRTNGTESKINGQSNMTFAPETLIAIKKTPNTPQYKPYVNYMASGRIGRHEIFKKGKCANITPIENSLNSPEPKLYPVLLPKYTTNPGLKEGWPSFQIAFELYKKGNLKLNLLYLFWGKNLGVHFFETVFDLVTCYQSFGRTTFKIAIECMIESLALPSYSLPDIELERDMNVLADLSDSLLD